MPDHHPRRPTLRSRCVHRSSDGDFICGSRTYVHCRKTRFRATIESSALPHPSGSFGEFPARVRLVHLPVPQRQEGNLHASNRVDSDDHLDRDGRHRGHRTHQRSPRLGTPAQPKGGRGPARRLAAGFRPDRFARSERLRHDQNPGDTPHPGHDRTRSRDASLVHADCPLCHNSGDDYGRYSVPVSGIAPAAIDCAGPRSSAGLRTCARGGRAARCSTFRGVLPQLRVSARCRCRSHPAWPARLPTRSGPRQRRHRLRVRRNIGKQFHGFSMHIAEMSGYPPARPGFTALATVHAGLGMCSRPNCPGPGAPACRSCRE